MVLHAAFLFFVLFTASSLGFKCHARVDIRDTRPLILPKDASEPILSAENSQKILPKKIEPGETGDGVLSEMVDNSFSLWWNNSPVRNTAVGQVADSVDKKLKTEVSLGKSADQKIEHKISVKVLAVQALAKIEYTGWVRADVNYDVKAAKTEAEILESISANKDLIVSHSMTAEENRSQVSLLWNW